MIVSLVVVDFFLNVDTRLITCACAVLPQVDVQFDQYPINKQLNYIVGRSLNHAIFVLFCRVGLVWFSLCVGSRCRLVCVSEGVSVSYLFPH